MFVAPSTPCGVGRGRVRVAGRSLGGRGRVRGCYGGPGVGAKAGPAAGGVERQETTGALGEGAGEVVGDGSRKVVVRFAALRASRGRRRRARARATPRSYDAGEGRAATGGRRGGGPRPLGALSTSPGPGARCRDPSALRAWLRRVVGGRAGRRLGSTRGRLGRLGRLGRRAEALPCFPRPRPRPRPPAPDPARPPPPPSPRAPAGAPKVRSHGAPFVRPPAFCASLEKGERGEVEEGKGPASTGNTPQVPSGCRWRRDPWTTTNVAQTTLRRRSVRYERFYRDQ